MIWFVALGSAAGGSARYVLTIWIQRLTSGSFPAATLPINVTGSFALGILARGVVAAPSWSPEVRLALTTGFCGGCTTFSTFSLETVSLIESGQWRQATLHVVVSALAGILAMFAGVLVARAIHGPKAP
jgi:CrcB protein